MIARTHRISALGAIAFGLALLYVQGAAASTVSPLPASDYSVRSACHAPEPGHAGCLALELVPDTAAARARTHPLGMTRSAPIRAGKAAEGADGLRPEDLHSAYSLPTAASSAQTIALIDAYNDPEAETDLKVYDEEFGLPACTTANGCFTKLNQQGKSSPLPPTEGGWSLEISLDIEVVHAVCENCHILLVEAETAAYANLEVAEDAAAVAGATEISNSWGGEEPSVDGAAFEHPGVVITAAAGDDGYLNWDALSNAEHGFADYPASSPHVIAVGGTRLELNSPANTWKSETVWNGDGATGGGCSARFDAQPWQQELPDWSDVGCSSKRAVADVSADADPYTGVAVYDTTPYEGEVLKWLPVGGTSLASPLIAAVFALAGGAHGVEYPAKTLYENEINDPGSLHDVQTGSNGECTKPFNSEGLSGCSATEEAVSCSEQLICLAGPGYDGPTGIGTPNGTGAFEPTSTNSPTVATEAASSLTQTSATLNATVNPNGANVSECKFEYGTSTRTAPARRAPRAGVRLEPRRRLRLDRGPDREHRIPLPHLGDQPRRHQQRHRPNIQDTPQPAGGRHRSSLGGHPDHGDPQCHRERQRRERQRMQVRIRHHHQLRHQRPMRLTPRVRHQPRRRLRPGHGPDREHRIPLPHLSDQPRRHQQRHRPNIQDTPQPAGGRHRSSLGGHPDHGDPQCHRERQRRERQRMQVRIRHQHLLRHQRPMRLAARVRHQPSRRLRPGHGPSRQHRIPLPHRRKQPRRHKQEPGRDVQDTPQPPDGRHRSSIGRHPDRATLNAKVNPNGANVSECKFEYDTSTSYGNSVPCTSLPGSGTSPVAVSAPITGLAANTEYHYRIVATNPGGTRDGTDETFKTLPNPPTVATEAASAATQTAATLNAKVNPNGANVSECKFEYGTTTSYEHSEPCKPPPGSGTSPVAVSAPITGLTANTEYHYRIVATNPGGTRYGEDRDIHDAIRHDTAAAGPGRTADAEHPGGAAL